MKRFVRLGWLCLTAACLLMGGCFGGGKTKGADGQVPLYHVWGSLTSPGGEDEGYALYTYVILDGDTNTRSEGGRRNQALLDAIVEAAAIPGEAVRSPGEPTVIRRQECNIFYIPLTQKELPQFASPLALYNLPLAQQLVAGFVQYMQGDQDLSQRLQYSSPFLVSVPVPLTELNSRRTAMLVADLTSTSPKKMRQVVAAFRQPQTANVVDEVDRFRLIRLALFDGVLPLKYVSIVKTAPVATMPSDGYGR